jgi:hypothetical protein
MTPPREKDDPPGAISDQNREEQPSEFRDDETHPEPRTSENPADRERSKDDSAG